MAFNPAPTQLLPNATNGTNTLVINTADHGDPSLPELTDAEAHVTTGDWRKIAYAFAEQLYDHFVSLDAADRPTMLNVIKQPTQIVNSNQQLTTYIIQFTTDTSAEVADEPA